MSWSIGPRFGLNKTEIVDDETGNAVASVWTHRPGATDKPQARSDFVEWPEGMRRARLIATGLSLSGAMENARAAIAKAKGES